MNILFTELEETMVAEPTGPKEVTKTDKDEVMTMTVSIFEETIYNKQSKQLILDEEILKVSIRHIYYILCW